MNVILSKRDTTKIKLFLLQVILTH